MDGHEIWVAEFDSAEELGKFMAQMYQTTALLWSAPNGKGGYTVKYYGGF